MKFQNNKSISYLELVSNPLCVAGVSTRNGGCSKGNFYSLNVGRNTADSIERVQKNRNALFNAVAPGFKVVYMQQMHSDIVHMVDADFTNNTEGDAFFTQERGILLTIATADCAPIVIHDEDFSIIAAIHCGWRGAQQNIIQKTIAQLGAYVNPELLVAHIGPMIQQDYYEVGAEFLDIFPEEYFKTLHDKYYLNLNTLVEDALVDSDIGRIVNTRIGTFSQPDYFFSYRRDGETGRMLTYIGLL